MHHRSEISFLQRYPRAVALLFFVATLSLGACTRETTTVGSQYTTQPIALPADQARAVSLLLDARPRNPVPLFLFTDPNKDPDDLSVLVLVNALQEQGFVDLRCVVTTLGDRETRTRRARFAKDVLEDLGLDGVEVGVGGDYGFEVKDAGGKLDLKATEGRRKDHQVFIDTPFGQPRGAVETDGLALLKAELARVPERSAVLLVNAGMADLAALLRDAPTLVKRKTAKVVIIRDQQKQSLEHLWAGIYHGHLPPALTPEWFFGTFTDLDLDSPAGKAALTRAEADPEDFEAIWRQVNKLDLYDPLALLAATPGSGERLFSADVPAGTRNGIHFRKNPIHLVKRI